MSGTVLVVDDSPDTLGMLTAALDAAGYVVLVALDGQRALEIVARAQPDLILLDALMPDLDGFETCRRLRRLPRAAMLPVIFMTGLTDTDHVIRGLQAGAVDYVAKPVNVRELLARIAVHLAAARMMRSACNAIERSGHALFAAHRDGVLRWATPGAERLLAVPGVAGALGDWLAGERERLLLPRTDGEAIEIIFVGEIGPDEILLRIDEAQASRDERRLRGRLPVTPREAEVLLWLSRGKTNRDIADILGLSPRTVNKHLEQAYAKLGVENRAAAVALTLGALQG